MRIEKIAVIGAGLMGHGVAQVFSQLGGYAVSLFDVDKAALERGISLIKESLQRFISKGKLNQAEADQILYRISGAESLRDAVGEADLVVEAASENPKIKFGLFKNLDRMCPKHTVLASNTSSISISRLASATTKPERVCGMHFFNPPQLIRMVEIVPGRKTSSQIIQTILGVAQKIGFEYIVLNKDSPGFVVNRILAPALNESIRLIEEGVADKEDIDKAIKLGLGWPMGPLYLADYIGLDTLLAILNVLSKSFGTERFGPARVLVREVKKGNRGKKTGRGFYAWN